MFKFEHNFKDVDKKINVLFLCSWYPSRTNDTSGNFVEKHIEAVSKHVNPVVFAYFSDENCKKFEVVKNKKDKSGILEIIIYYPNKSNIFFLKQLKLIIRYFKIIKELLSILKSKKIDLIHVNVAYPIGFLALFLYLYKKIPFVVTEHSTIYSKDNTKIPIFQKWVSKVTFNHAKMLLPVSENLGSSILLFSKNKNIKVVPNVVDVDIFILKEIVPNEITKFIHISTAKDEQKNLSGIIEVFARVLINNPNTHLKIISDFSLDKYKFLAKRLKINDGNISFYGKSTTKEIANFLGKSDALVLFSNYENFPCVIPESFSVGIPVIATKINGIPEYVNETNGILVEAKNKEQLEKAFQQIIAKERIFNPVELRKYAIEHFSYESVGNKIVSAYKEIINVS
jgi:L-malate glycosyltransferase